MINQSAGRDSEPHLHGWKERKKKRDTNRFGTCLKVVKCMQEKWIPCDDYLPECGRYVPVTLANGALFVGKVEIVKGEYKWVFGHDNVFDLKVMAGSTMPVNRNAMLDLMIRLAQTNGEDGLPLVDRKAVLEFLPTGDKKAITDRFEQVKQQVLDCFDEDILIVEE